MTQEMRVLGIDIAKRVFHAVGMDERGQIVLRKRLSRQALMPFIAQLPPVLIGMEACGGSHYWARRFRAHGHDVKLLQGWRHDAPDRVGEASAKGPTA
jgi:transposase